MTGLWKAWKAKSRLTPLSTSPLEISPKAGEISTFPPLRRRRRMEKWKTKARFPTFPPPRFPSSNIKERNSGQHRHRPWRRSTPPQPTSSNWVTLFIEATRAGVLIVADQTRSTRPSLLACSIRIEATKPSPRIACSNSTGSTNQSQPPWTNWSPPSGSRWPLDCALREQNPRWGPDNGLRSMS
jgi:hypothetical protein